MGYEVHITRKASWFDDGNREITLDEWSRYIDSDPEMRLDGFAEAVTPDGQVLRMENPGIAVWVAYSGHNKDGNMAWFTHFNEHISVKNPDEEILRKMYSIARDLGAKVQGDEGEEYGADGQSDRDARQQSGNGAWWKFWK